MARARQDAYDKLMEYRLFHTQYPKSLLRPRLTGHMLEVSAERFQNQRPRLFRELPEAYHEISLDLHELFEGAEEYETSQILSHEELDDHLSRHPKDPICRHVFVQADNQRPPLNCTCAMFTFLLTHHQVMESFLDLIISWSGQEPDVDSHYTDFHSDDLLFDIDNDGVYVMRPLGRSGKEIRHCYNLRSVRQENSEWTICQTIVYHAFDVREGKALWFTISAGSDVRTAMKEAKSLHAQPSHMVGNRMSFQTTLDTHLIIHEWCSGPWRWYNNALEDRLTKELTRLNAARLESLSGIANGANLEAALNSFKGLTSLSSRLHKAGLVLELNIGVLEEIRLYYERVIRASDFQSAFEERQRRDNEAHLAEFIEKVSGIVRDLAAEKNRIQTLSRLLDDAKGIYQNLQINTRMENVAKSTEKQTRSMHIITLVTLIFLPATFVSTFFGSGILASQPGSWVFDPQLFSLFAKICFPMTAIVVAFWVGFSYSGRILGVGRAIPLSDEERALKND